ncbi:exonuclease sbcCD subunit D [Lachnoclostridium sp. An14]|mgnify:FL=1|uniref:exonuclease SbcCD subunit D n=1 Tax=Lachnoclostridium sp. An14 TaxID=1965562 RepID=UPI000B38B898|nr:exonuclease SbcCD subunit D [Lachnoclostridium sp. An14]OUQ17231.1 exonuclease sbcCD subunit D [Lachnoclostridium sp. An14]
MKLLHLSDLHLGKRVNEFSMLEDQEYILEEILRVLDGEQPDAVLIAGDVYDKPVPPAEAVQLFDKFLTKLAAKNTQTFLISGNHDSSERLAFGARLMEGSGIHISPVYGGEVKPVELADEFGPVRVYLLPFVKPASVKRFSPEREIGSYTEAVAAAVDAMDLDPAVRNVLVTHQFVTGASRSESEEISVGGSDNVDVSVFDGFDYVALGHVHGPQNIGSERVRYCGTPLKYSFSEVKHAKSVTIAELGKKGELTVRTVPLIPKRDLAEIRGTYMELTAKAFYEGKNREDYYHITLTDEEDIRDAVGRLRVIYPNLMKLDYDNLRTRLGGRVEVARQVEKKTPLELFAEFYRKQNNQDMSSEQASLVEGLIESIWEEEP